jgi:outer membrane protein OmpU
MKKVLLATSALVLTAGVAAAETSFSGDARMGLQYNSAGFANANNTVRLEKRFSFNIDGKTTTDGGVTLGARVRLRSDENAATLAAGARVYATYGGLTVAAGNILGAIESMPNLYSPSVGLTGLSWGGLVTNVSGLGHGFFDWDAYSSNGNGAEGVEVIYTMSGFTLHASHSSDGLRGVAGNAQRTAIHGAYTWNGWTFALAYQDSTAAADIEDKIVATIGGKIGDFSVGLGYGSNGSGANKIDKFALNGSATFGATTVNAYVANQNFSGVTNPTTYGLGVSYALGGGARIVGGIESTSGGATRGDLGVAFNF